MSFQPVPERAQAVLTWEEVHGSWRGFDDRRCLMAIVVRYDVPPGWAAFLRQERAPGVWATAEEAQCAADDRHTAKG